MDYGIWLSWNHQQDGFNLPVLPEEIGTGLKGAGAEHQVYGLGKINVIGDRGLSEYEISSFFPARAYPFIAAEIVLEPKAYIDKIVKWLESKQPIQLVCVGMGPEINTYASIESFEWRDKAGAPGDIEYSLKLKEYRFYSARSVQPIKQQTGSAAAPAVAKAAPKRADDRVQPKTYTLASGDTLWKVAQKMLGDGSRWPEIQKLNGISDAQIKKLRIGQVLKLPEAKAHA